MPLSGKFFKKDGARRRKRDGQGDDVADDPENSQLGSQACRQLKQQPTSGLFDVIEDDKVIRGASTVIVAVHGLGGNWLKTWESEKDGWNWIQSSLGPKLLEETGISARVLSFGYDSNKVRQRYPAGGGGTHRGDIQRASEDGQHIACGGAHSSQFRRSCCKEGTEHCMEQQ
ncbi:hypothetical protein BDV19DRAFT_20674 [Aspergillus venezuelensis]